jgi:hypothetical protein
MTEKEFYGDLFVNEIFSGIRIEYKYNHEMHLHGLLPENPPHLVLERDKTHHSHDGKQFITHGNGFGFQIFRILDPRIISSDVYQPTMNSENQSEMKINYDCQVIGSHFSFNQDFLSGLVAKQKHRHDCSLHFDNGKISAMKQFNICYPKDMLEIRFKEEKGADLMFCQKTFSQIVQ